MAKRILLVDDEPLILKGLTYTLEQEGYETNIAMDGEEALSKFMAHPYDLVLLDVMLPKMDGLTLCQRIREVSNVPIIMLTAKGEDMDKILGLEYGADDYMTKPLTSWRCGPASARCCAASTACPPLRSARSCACVTWRSICSSAPAPWATSPSV